MSSSRGVLSDDTRNHGPGFGARRPADGRQTATTPRAARTGSRESRARRRIVPDPKALVNGKAQYFATDKHPVQSFLWGDYTARPGTDVQVQGRSHVWHGLEHSLPLEAGTAGVRGHHGEEDDPAGHGDLVQSRRARESGLRPRVRQHQAERAAARRSTPRRSRRGCHAACWKRACDFINDVPAGEALRACVYEFTYPPMLNAFKAAIDRGVDVQIATTRRRRTPKPIAAAELPRKVAATRRSCSRGPSPRFRTTSSSSASPTESRSRSGPARRT